MSPDEELVALRTDVFQKVLTDLKKIALVSPRSCSQTIVKARRSSLVLHCVVLDCDEFPLPLSAGSNGTHASALSAPLPRLFSQICVICFLALAAMSIVLVLTTHTSI